MKMRGDIRMNEDFCICADTGKISGFMDGFTDNPIYQNWKNDSREFSNNTDFQFSVIVFGFG
jgi:hypothetical protein